MSAINRQSETTKQYGRGATIPYFTLAFAIILFIIPSGLFAQVSSETDSIQEEALQFRQLSIENGLLDNEIEDIIQDKNGFIWLATGQGLVKYDGINYNNYYHSVKKLDSISSNITTSISEDQNGNIWVGSENGLNRLASNASGFKRYFHDPQTTTSLANNHVHDLLVDGTNRLWVATESTLH
ncbi:MAG: hypothetical protein HKP09_04730, partial [Enterobacterales bacterium]|nr:hypothetical protein [Enterobacterales bacterium]